ncbi:hypothetical protein BDN72DRAFT_960350 [Pluteus cervinus]|uniref:Uncharacterized protein n=1 Tax=Pluteus cervinus TaxID=181527 RepID=A0ACD3AQP6_9AGAR|nr:hypothetical protein BDN72DRAFT_960350 [Pluteus cervinus]
MANNDETALRVEFASEEKDMGSTSKADNEQLLFLTALLRVFPRLWYHVYRFNRSEEMNFLIDEEEEVERDPDVECLSRLLCLLVRSEEVVAAIPVSAGVEGSNLLDLVISWSGGDNGTATSRDDPKSVRLSEVVQSLEIVTSPTSDASVKDMFLAERYGRVTSAAQLNVETRRNTFWEIHANRVFHLVKMAHADNYEWLARYLLLANAEHTLRILKHPLCWRELFGRLTFRELDYEALEEEDEFPYPSKTGLRRLLSGEENTTIKQLAEIVEASNAGSIACIQGQPLRDFLDNHKSELGLLLNQELLLQILSAIHSLFRASLGIIFTAYRQVVDDPECVLRDDSRTYKQITEISFAFHRLLRGKFVKWMITSFDSEFRGLFEEGMLKKEGTIRTEIDPGPQVIGETPKKFGRLSQECWFWLRSCFEAIHNLEQVVKSRYLKIVRGFRFFDFPAASLAPSVSDSPTIMADWPDVVLQLRRNCVGGILPEITEQELAPHDNFVMSLKFYSNQGAVGFEWANQKNFVVRPELHPEVILATFHFWAMMGLERKGAWTGTVVDNIFELFSGSGPTSIIGTSKPCCVTCTEIIQGLSRVLEEHEHHSIYLAWSHEIASPGTFPDIFPANVRSHVLEKLGSQVFRLLRIAVAEANGNALFAVYRQQLSGGGLNLASGGA